MRRRIIGVAAALAIALAIGGTANADFHPACNPFNSAAAGVSLTQSGGSFTYSGNVNCPGASITITSLTLSQRPAGPSYSAASVSCANSCAASASAPAATGLWRVRMVFSASGHGFNFPAVTRCRTYAWNSGQPVPLDNLGCLV